MLRGISLMIASSGILLAQDTGLARREYAQAVLAGLRGDAEGKARHEEAARIAHPTAIMLADRSAKRAIKAGDIKTASTLYRTLAEDRPDSLRAQFLYTDFLRSQSAEDDFALRLAVEKLEALQQKQPAHPEVLERLLRLYEQQGQRAKSEALYQNYLKQPQADPSVAELFSRILRDQDDAQSQEQLDRMYRERIEETPEDPNLARAASEHFRKTKRVPEAIALLEKHVKAAPSSLDMRVRLGILLLADKKEAAGEATLLAALAIDPSLFVAHQSLAKLYDQQKKPELARKHRSEMLKLRGGDASEFLEVAREFLNAKDAKAARILLEKACFDYPKDVDLLYLRAVATHLDAAESAKAPALFDEAEKLAKEPTRNPLYLRHAAESYWTAKQTEKAESRLRDAIKAYPATEKKESAAAIRLLASWWQQQNKNADAAKALLQRAEMLER
jgi:predicted Zn-dependent protease